MSNTYHHHHRRFRDKAPRWYTNLFVRRPEAAHVRDMLRKIVVKQDAELFQTFPKGRKPNANGEWC